MPRRTKLPTIPDYTGIPNDEKKLIVQKSNPLQSLSETNLSLTEFKILDAYLGKIDSHVPDKRYVRFEKGELEKILGVSRILKDDLSKRLDGLFTAVTIHDPNKPKGFIKIGLFSKAEANQDEQGLWQVDLACTPEAMEYIFNIDTMGYLPYMLKNVIELTSRYSYILYLFLEKNRFRKTLKISIEELKQMLHCKAARYSEYKYFNAEILKKCYNELNKKTSLHFEYEPTDKKGRKYTAIQFTIKTLSDFTSEEPLSGQLTFDVDNSNEKEIDYGSELADLLGSAALNDEFSPEQVRVLQDLVLKAACTSDHIEMCNYLLQKVHTMNYYETRNPIKNRFLYLKNMLENEIKEMED